MVIQYSDFIFAYFCIALVISLQGFISLNHSLLLLSNRKLRNEKVFVRACSMLSKRTIQLSIVWPYLLATMSLQSWKVMRESHKKAVLTKKDSTIKVVAKVLPPRSKPKQMTRRNKSE
jgi:hypothetical protein